MGSKMLFSGSHLRYRWPRLLYGLLLLTFNIITLINGQRPNFAGLRPPDGLTQKDKYLLNSLAVNTDAGGVPELSILLAMALPNPAGQPSSSTQGLVSRPSHRQFSPPVGVNVVTPVPRINTSLNTINPIGNANNFLSPSSFTESTPALQQDLNPTIRQHLAQGIQPGSGFQSVERTVGSPDAAGSGLLQPPFITVPRPEASIGVFPAAPLATSFGSGLGPGFRSDTPEFKPWTGVGFSPQFGSGLDTEAARRLNFGIGFGPAVNIAASSGAERSLPRIPVDAGGDRQWVESLNRLPLEQRPFWLINHRAIESQRNFTNF